MSTRLFPTCCEIHEWLYRVSWRSVPSLLKYTSGVKIRGLQSVQPCWQTTPNTYLMRRGKLFVFYFLNSYASLLHTAPVHIQLYPLPSVCITSWKWQRKPFCHNATRLLDMSPVSVTDRLHEHLNVLLRAVWQWASSLLRAGRGWTHSWCPQACEGEEPGRWLAACELLFRGAPGMMLSCKSHLIQEHLVHDLEAFLLCDLFSE